MGGEQQGGGGGLRVFQIYFLFVQAGATWPAQSPSQLCTGHCITY